LNAMKAKTAALKFNEGGPNQISPKNCGSTSQPKCFRRRQNLPRATRAV
jgi:hypothetical protein